MRIVFWSFFVFLAAFSLLLPLFEPSWVLPEEYALAPLIALMVLSIILQIEAMALLKFKGRMKSLSHEHENLKKHNNQKQEELQSELLEAQASLEEARKAAQRTKEALADLKLKGTTLSGELENYKTALKDTEAKLAGALVEQESKSSDHKEVVTLLSLLQEKGRLLDFLMDDITAYPDEQVGAAGRIIHQGCRKVLGDYLKIVPLMKEAEGEKVSVPNEEQAALFKLIGSGNGQEGTLLHRGWKVNEIQLPERFLKNDSEALSVLAPAEIEIN